MPNTLSPDSLQAARLARGLGIAALGKASGISTATLSRIEQGKRPASDDEANSLAEALSLPIAAICRPLVSGGLGLSAFYHRKLSRAGARAVSSIENQCLLDVVALRDLVGIVNVETPRDVPEIHLDDIKNGDIEQAANMVRLAWQVPRGPIGDLCELVESAGCLVIHTDFEVPEVDALYQKVAGMHPIFWVNSRKPLDRVRMNIAHELGHLILHEDEPEDVSVAEDQAKRFASAFLMPRSEFRSECPSRLGIPELVELKRRWRCSMQSIIVRARQVGKINEYDYRRLNIMISKRGWKKREPYPIAGESPRLLAGVIDSALHETHMGEDELADRLAVTLSKLRSWRQPFPGQKPAIDQDSPQLRLVGF